MKITEISKPIATRKLSVGSEAVVVTIGKPELFEDGNDYYCPYAIDFLGKKKMSYAGGADAVQAIQLAMQKIGVDLAYLKTPSNERVTWMSDSPGETGFPAE
ncbi:DUF6968 family protein [Woeseia oceani]|uniref:DUF6968 domain-containing protein n=1 Tax=Woeseia oceani TaxID=1548547 RepID=A0A193LJT8_9GAMM|nr:hypothetical protein [Woeseia oceani]ANO52664.1 hypothetical protein BA177_17035 [Woeseia oceani]